MIDEDTGSGDMCMLYEIQARSELGHDRLGREAVADRGRRRARGRVEAQHGAARAGDFGVGGVARHERAQRRRAVGEGVDDRRQDARKWACTSAPSSARRSCIKVPRLYSVL